MSRQDTIFEKELRDRVEAEYRRRECRLGWRLLYSPAKTMNGAKVAFVGLNPGGKVARPDQGEFAMPSGSAYVDEGWTPGLRCGESPLQRQVRMLFDRLGAAPETVLAGNLVPFRSPNWNSLPNRDQAVRFGISVWRSILERARPEIVVTMGSIPRHHLSIMMDVENFSQVPVGWGRVKAFHGHFAGGKFVGLPHLSRFAIMGRPASSEALNILFGTTDG